MNKIIVSHKRNKQQQQQKTLKISMFNFFIVYRHLYLHVYNNDKNIWFRSDAMGEWNQSRFHVIHSVYVTYNTIFFYVCMYFIIHTYCIICLYYVSLILRIVSSFVRDNKPLLNRIIVSHTHTQKKNLLKYLCLTFS